MTRRPPRSTLLPYTTLFRSLPRVTALAPRSAEATVPSRISVVVTAPAAILAVVTAPEASWVEAGAAAGMAGAEIAAAAVAVETKTPAVILPQGTAVAARSAR